MQTIHPRISRKTSVSLPEKSYRRLRAARQIFARNGLFYSDQEIYRRLFKLFLKHWRGRGRKTNGLRRYNTDGKAYEIHPLYINQVLHSILWQRALHSGESISRMLDIAIRVYLPRLLESLLQTRVPGSVSRRNNASYWAARHQARRLQYSDFFINYEGNTGKNEGGNLEYSQNVRIISKAGLSLREIWEWMHIAA